MQPAVAECAGWRWNVEPCECDVPLDMAVCVEVYCGTRCELCGDAAAEGDRLQASQYVGGVVWVDG